MLWVTLTLEATSAIAACVYPRGVVITNAPNHTSAVGLYNPQVASHLPPEPGRGIKSHLAQLPSCSRLAKYYRSEASVQYKTTTWLFGLTNSREGTEWHKRDRVSLRACPPHPWATLAMGQGSVI